MILYHYTDPDAVKSIRGLGIIRGDIPSGALTSFGAVALTVDDNHSHQKGWAGDSDKWRSRIAVDIPESELRLLKDWPQVVRWLEIDQAFIELLDEKSMYTSASWFVFFGKIEPAWIVIVAEKLKA